MSKFANLITNPNLKKGIVENLMASEQLKTFANKFEVHPLESPYENALFNSAKRLVTEPPEDRDGMIEEEEKGYKMQKFRKSNTPEKYRPVRNAYLRGNYL